MLGFHEKPVTNYPAFDSESKSRICSLIAMECSVIEEAYMGLGTGQETEEIFLELKESCHHVQGCFTLLWHNAFCEKNLIKNLYRSIAVYKINA